VPDNAKPAESIASKRERLFAAMTVRLGHEPIRMDIDALNEVMLDQLLRHYANAPGLVW
jgi:hypothetical protein